VHEYLDMLGMNERDGHFEGVTTYHDLYNAQWRYLNDRRGADTMAPTPGHEGSSFPIPRATNADVRKLVSYWSGVAASVDPIIADDWQRTVDKFELLTKNTTPGEMYSGNNDLWHVLQKFAGPGTIAPREHALLAKAA